MSKFNNKLSFLLGLSCGHMFLLVLYLVKTDIFDGARVGVDSCVRKPGHEEAVQDNNALYRVDITAELNASLIGGPRNYLTNYKNPCWISQLNTTHPYDTNLYNILNIFEDYPDSRRYSPKYSFFNLQGTFAKRLSKGRNWRLRCLPYVYLVGVTKSGTTDLFDSLISHPDIVIPSMKETWWWNYHTIGEQKFQRVVPFPFSDYVDLFDESAEIIFQDARNESGNEYHPKIAIDGTPDYLWNYEGWQMIPGNTGLSEPRYILAHSIRALTPNVKIIAILRNPTERWFSHFRNDAAFNYIRGDMLHYAVKEVTELMSTCTRQHSVRHCSYHTFPSYKPAMRVERQLMLFLRASMYYTYVADWLSVFSRDQMLIVHAEGDYYPNRTRAMEKIYHFLGVSPQNIDQNPRRVVANRRVHTREELRSDTRLLLNNFFKPHNKMLADLLGDERYNW